MEIIAYIVAVATLLLGAKVTVDAAWVEQNKFYVGLSLVCLGLLGVGIGYKQDTSREKAEELRNQALMELKEMSSQLQNKTSKLQAASDEQKRLTEINSRQQLQVLALMERNSDLTEHNSKLTGQVLRTAQGDPDHPPYLYFSDFGFDTKPLRAQVYVKNSSKKYAAQNVTSSLRLDGITVTSRGTSVPPNSRAPSAFPNKFGVDSNTLHVPQLEVIGARVTLVAVIASSAGSFVQVTGLVRTSATSIVQAVRISRINDRSKVILSLSEPEFPVDFNWPR